MKTAHTSSSRWRSLNVNIEHSPKLVIKTRFDASGYQIELTDLSRIWREELTKDEIVEHALSSGSSIDPGEDDEQYDIFLSKIQSALDGENGTSLDLSSDTDGKANLTIKLSAPLPKPLPPFTWTIRLQLLPSQHVEHQLVSPLLVQASQLQKQISVLIAELSNKDRVISKICDRLEHSGNDLTTVFPGVSNVKTNRKKSQREQLAGHVKGLADFKEDVWRRESGRGPTDGQRDLGVEEVQAVLEGLVQPPPSDGLDDRYGRWWEHLDGSSQPHSRPHINGKEREQQGTDGKQGMGNGVSSEREQDMQDDQFQRQQTPPRLKRQMSDKSEDVTAAEPERIDADAGTAPAHAGNAVDDESTTEDEDDLDAPPRRPTPPRRKSLTPDKPAKQHSSMSRSPRKLGMIGRSSRVSTAPTTEHPPREQSTKAKPRPKLGMIGGKAKSPSPSPASTAPDLNRSISRSPPRASKIGVIGGKRSEPSTLFLPESDEGQPPQSPNEPSTRRARATEQEPTPLQRETSQERADRKRDQLKRELEEKAKAPAKKKRKF